MIIIMGQTWAERPVNSTMNDTQWRKLGMSPKYVAWVKNSSV